MERYNRISEIFWMVMSIVTLSLSVYMISIKGFEVGKWYLFLSLIPCAVYLMRRMLRLRFEKTKREMEEKSKKNK